MRCEEVIEFYKDLETAGIDIWIDGGWAVDAAVGHQTRAHDDLDIAVEAKNVENLLKLFALRGFKDVPSSEASRWNFVVANERAQRIDVHVVVLDESLGVLGEPLDGIAYPAGSLTGQGILAGVTIRCVHPDFLLQFKTSYPPRPVDRHDIAVLCVLLGKPAPTTHS